MARSKIDGISASDMKQIRVAAKRHVADGMSPREAMAKAVDAEIEESQNALDSVADQLKPKPSTRNIRTSLRP